MTESRERTDSQREFMRRVMGEWLPAFCADSKRQYDPKVFKPEGKVIADADARDFLRAVDSGVAFFAARQRLGMRHGRACEPMFTEGEKKIQPRPVYLWVETVLTVAAGARLHFEHGWPVDLLGMQPNKDSALDLAAYRPTDLINEFIAGEIKPTARELAALSKNLRKCCTGEHDEACIKDKAKRNAHRKYSALQARKPAIFWLVGPSPHNEVYRLSYPSEGIIEMQQTDSSGLNFSETKT